MSRKFALAAALAAALTLGAGPARAQNAYVTNASDDSVSVIDTTTNALVATIPLPAGSLPEGVAVSPDGTRAYVTNVRGLSVSVIDTASNAVVATVPVPSVFETSSEGGGNPIGVAVTPDGKKAYVAISATSQSQSGIMVIDTATNAASAAIINDPGIGLEPFGVAISPDGKKAYLTSPYAFTGSGYGPALSVIDTASNAVAATVPLASQPSGGVAVTPDGGKVYIPEGLVNAVAVVDTATSSVASTIAVGKHAYGVAISPDGGRAFVTNYYDASVSVIDTGSNGVVATIGVGGFPIGVAPTPDGGKVFVANSGSNSVSVIDTATNSVIATVPVGRSPLAFGRFIQPGSTAPPPPLVDGNHCNGVFGGTFTGKIRVRSGQSCTFVAGSKIIGEVSVTGGLFKLDGTVEGDVGVSGQSGIALDPGAKITGKLLITSLSGPTKDYLCGATVGGSLLAIGNASPLEIGSNNPATCPGNTIGGSLIANLNSAELDIDDNAIGDLAHLSGDAQINSNDGPTDVSGNTIGHDLQCLGNRQGVTYVTLNQVGRSANGQCAVAP